MLKIALKVTNRRIVNPKRYLDVISPGESFYVASKLDDADLNKLRNYGIFPNEIARIPSPIGSATQFNAKGKWIALKNLPKEVRHIERPYHIVDWHGRDHYGVAVESRLCYQRQYFFPTKVTFAINDGMLYSPLLKNTDSDLEQIKAAMNTMLEMIGRFEIWTEGKTPALPAAEGKMVPWEILRSGTMDEELREKYLAEIIKNRPKSEQVLIRDRHEFLKKLNPDFCVLGKHNFWGYIVYSFNSEKLFLFECNRVNNATYVFRGDWETASQLSKTEVLKNQLQEKRLYHTESWYSNVEKQLASYIGEEK